MLSLFEKAEKANNITRAYDLGSRCPGGLLSGKGGGANVLPSYASAAATARQTRQ